MFDCGRVYPEKCLPDRLVTAKYGRVPASAQGAMLPADKLSLTLILTAATVFELLKSIEAPPCCSMAERTVSKMYSSKAVASTNSWAVVIMWHNYV